METVVSSKTKLYAVIGDPISHSLSPDIHNRVFREMKLNRNYISLKIQPSYLKESLSIMKDNFDGFNVTQPHKEKIIPFLEELDERAKTYGAVNTVKLENNMYKGYNTDGYGFMRSLEAESINIAGEKVLVLGAGGAARVIAYEMLLTGCKVTIANRTIEKAQELKKDLMKTTGATNIDVATLNDIEGSYKIVINTTPIGMNATLDSMVIEERLFKNVETAYDLIYNPYKTKFLETAERNGCRILNGFSMLFYQAIKSQEIWMSTTICSSIATSIFKEIEESIFK